MLCTAGVRLMEGSIRGFAAGFAALFGLAWAARAVACDSALSDRGVNYAITSLALGLFISNVLGVPEWLRTAMRTEYYIKAGLVIPGLERAVRPGAGGRHVRDGAGGCGDRRHLVPVLLGRPQAPGRRGVLGHDGDGGVNLRGVGPPSRPAGPSPGPQEAVLRDVAGAGGGRADDDRVPLAVDWLGLSEHRRRAWIGGTIDTTGAVVVAGESIGDSATNAATIVKLSQTPCSAWPPSACRSGGRCGAAPPGRTLPRSRQR